MAVGATPRGIARGLVQGVEPPRPLFLPIVFSHGARIENLTLRQFLNNPTKISSSLRQIRGHLGADGITCYFDPFLELEALGGRVEWNADGSKRSLAWPQHPAARESLSGTAAPERSDRVAVGVEVIRRMKPMVRDDCLLCASVSGPLTLGAHLSELGSRASLRYEDLDSTAVDRAAAVMTGIAKAFVEAGAQVIFLREETLPPLSESDLADWMSRLATAINIVRFYEALPVLLLTDPRSAEENSALIARERWDAVVSPAFDELAPERLEKFRGLMPSRFGVALPPKQFEPGDTSGVGIGERVRGVVSRSHPAIVTTGGDVPVTADMERLKKVWENIRW